MKLHRHLIAQIIAALEAVFGGGRRAEQVVEEWLKRHPKWGSRDRRLFAGAVYDIVRWWRWHWHLAGGDSAQDLVPAAVTPEMVWRVWTTWWLAKGEPAPDFPECAGLSAEAVAARAAMPVTRAVRASVPDWLDALGAAELGDRWPDVLDALNQPAPVYLRVNTLKTTREAAASALAGERIETTPVDGQPHALRLEARQSLAGTQTFKNGLVEIQDASSQQVAPLLGVEPGQRVIDACAGGGGKTLHLAALMKNQGSLVALDIHAWKLDELRRRAQRNGIACLETRPLRDDTLPASLLGRADRVLLDVPCSGLGVLRRHPDTKWKLQPEELDRLRHLQRDLLARHSALVRPGGRLVYATCSILPSENGEAVRHFLAGRGDEWSIEVEKVLLPDVEDSDGFYAALLVRKE